MTLLPIILLALIQGITEFLPISSSGHLVLAHAAMDKGAGAWSENLMLDVAVHIGTLGAVLAYFWRDIKAMIIAIPATLTLKKNNDTARLNGHLLLASLPVIAAGFILFALQPTFLRSVEIMAWASILFGILLGIADKKFPETHKLETLTWKNALFIGLAQALALIPGTSRSGITMTAGRFLGLTRTASARFSLLLSIIAITGAGTLAGKSLIQSGNTALGIDALIAAILSGIVGFASIAVMMKWLQNKSFMPFVIYRIVLGFVILGLIYTGSIPS